MSSSPACPSDDDLFALARSQLEPVKAAAIQKHLAQCEACCAAVAEAARGLAGEASPAPEADESSRKLRSGDRLGRYLIGALLGEGAMGAVYVAQDPELNRRVAIKVLRTDARLGIGKGELQARLLREAQAMARLSHPNVVSVFEAAEVQGQLFVAMELIEGGTLRSWLRERPRALDEILDVFIAAGRGLVAAHGAGIVHRDFKPDNVLIGRDGRVRVSDFGLARSTQDLSPPGPAITPAPPPHGASAPPLASQLPPFTSPTRLLSEMVGTPAYMSPEQLAGGSIDARSDVFSFCATLFEAVYRSLPFPARTLKELRAHHRSGPARAQANVAPPWLRELLESGLRAEPGDRPATLAALLERLESARRGEARAVEARTRRWRNGGAAALALALLAGLWFTRARLDARAACAEGARRIDGAWSLARRQQISEAFHQTHLVYADDAFSRVAAALDRFAASWPQAYEAACELGIGKSEEASQAYLRMACLSEQLASVEARSELFVHADAKLVEDAAAMASAFEEPEQCALGIALSAPPLSASLRPAVERLRADLARVKALGEADHLDEARALVQRAVSDARALPFRPVLAEALLAQGEIAMDSYDPNSAITAATDAAFVAEGSRHDVIAVRAWTLALRETAALALFEKGRELERHARAALERIGGDDLLMAELETAMGFLLTTVGKAEEALAMEVSARAHYRKTGRVDRFSSWLLNDEASALFVLGRYADSADGFERAVELKEKLLGPSHPDVGFGLSNLGSALTALGNYREAGVALARAHAIFAHALPDDHFAFLALSVNEGDLALAQGDAAAALAAYQHALTVAEHNGQLPNPNTLEARLGLGRSQLALGRTREAIETLEQAMPAQESAVDPFVLADLRFALAQGLSKLGGDAARIQLLTSQARAAYLASGERGKAPLAELSRWMEAGQPR